MDFLQEDEFKNIVSSTGKIIIPKTSRQSCEVFSRVVGYYRPVQNWNKGKAEEFKERKEFNETACMESEFATANKPTNALIK